MKGHPFYTLQRRPQPKDEPYSDFKGFGKCNPSHHTTLTWAKPRFHFAKSAPHIIQLLQDKPQASLSNSPLQPRAAVQSPCPPAHSRKDLWTNGSPWDPGEQVMSPLRPQDPWGGRGDSGCQLRPKLGCQFSTYTALIPGRVQPMAQQPGSSELSRAQHCPLCRSLPIVGNLFSLCHKVCTLGLTFRIMQTIIMNKSYTLSPVTCVPWTVALQAGPRDRQPA